MRWLNWLPWRVAIGYYARAHGFLDPIALLTRLQSFAQPSEVGEPIELLRAGAVFHARGLVNSRVIQNNLDWIWPYWIERQFDPCDASFIPRAFSITHVNLTHRNWTAIGLPHSAHFPIIDPRGLVTPLYDGWSLDSWIVTDDGRCLLPSKAPSVSQWLELDHTLAVGTATQQVALSLQNRVVMKDDADNLRCELQLQAEADHAGWLVVALRPYNPEGISFVHRVALSDDRKAWVVDDKQRVEFSTAIECQQISSYQTGDVYTHLQDKTDQQSGECEVGLLTAAAMFRLKKSRKRTIKIDVPMPREKDTGRNKGLLWSKLSSGAQPPEQRSHAGDFWQEELRNHCELKIPEQHFTSLYDAAVTTLILHSPGDVYPGPYTYKRFWFRDAAFIVHGLMCAGLFQRAERVLDSFPGRQTAGGYFHSQEGEWDANGEVLWIMQRFCELSGTRPKQQWHKAVKRGADWIVRKRLSDTLDAPHAGLLPAGFSAEHLGPNDYYYWDDFWSIAGLRSAAALCSSLGDAAACEHYLQAAETFEKAVAQSLAKVVARLGYPALAASPYRRMDAGAIGSLVMGYPLQLCAADDARLLGTTEFLLQNCFVKGGFFQDMIHSGINPYLTLHIAQVLLRAGDLRYLELMHTVAALASPTGQWPEAVHPRTGGGCMGDGQHVWAAAEWLLMLRYCFVREEDGRLILCSGVAREWLAPNIPVHFGPAPTPFGSVSITITLPSETEQIEGEDSVGVSWQGRWHVAAPTIEIRVPGYTPVTAESGQNALRLAKAE